MTSQLFNLITIAIDYSKGAISVEISIWLILGIFLIATIVWYLGKGYQKKYKLTKMEISFGNIGKVEIAPNSEDLQIAHKIWTQLVTRKAAIPIDPQNDIIVEVYDSWYALFTQVREMISNIPADLLKKSKSTKNIVSIATKTLNLGLRPHLTVWQGKFRNWYNANSDKLKTMSPQELQMTYPEYEHLIADMKQINLQMIAYAEELKRLID